MSGWSYRLEREKPKIGGVYNVFVTLNFQYFFSAIPVLHTFIFCSDV